MIKTITRILQYFLLGVVTLFLLHSDCCPPVDIPESEPGWNTFESDAFFPMGNYNNTLAISKEFYAGHNVDSFRLKLIIPECRSLGGDPNVITTIISTQQGGVLQYIETHGDYTSLWTEKIPGNWVKIHMSSKYGLDFTGGPPYCRIDSIAYLWDDSYPQDYAPGANELGSVEGNQYKAATLTLNREIKGFLTYRKTDFYQVFLPSRGLYAVYISPLCYATANDVGLLLGVSTNGFVLPSWNNSEASGKVMPYKCDSGIYHEFSVSTSNPVVLYIAVRSGTFLPHDYTIVVNKVEERLDFVVEMDKGLADKTAPRIELPDPPYLNYLNPHVYDIHNYIVDDANYLRRLKEVLVFGTARMLNATEGYFRLNDIDIYESQHWYVNSDISVHDEYERAHRDWFGIDLYLCELDAPYYEGGGTLLHECGHSKFGLKEEYREYSNGSCETVDHNSVMGQYMFSCEFCTYLNHVWVDVHDLANETSCWEIIEDKYGFLPFGMLTYPSQQGEYMDVLNALERTLTFDYYK